MKNSLILVIFGLGLGGLLTLACLPLIKKVAYQYGVSSNGAEFSDLNDLRLRMVERDSRDLKQDKSVSLRSIIFPDPSDEIIYQLAPSLNVKFQGVDVRTNSCGMRGKESTVVKAANTHRIALLGDSFAFGWGVEEPLIFAQVLESLLNKFYGPEINFEILNFGTPGYSTFQQVALFEQKVLDFQPDSVLIFVVDNDFGLPFFVHDVGPNSSLSSGTLMDSTKFAKLSWSSKDKQVNKASSNLNSLLDPNRWMARMDELGNQYGFDTFVAINPNKSARSIKERLHVLKSRSNIKYLPMRRDFLKLVEERKIDPKSLSLPSDPHPSAIKHELLGEVLFKLLVAELGY